MEIPLIIRNTNDPLLIAAVKKKTKKQAEDEFIILKTSKINNRGLTFYSYERCNSITKQINMSCLFQVAPNLFCQISKINMKLEFGEPVSLCNFIICFKRHLLPTIIRHKLLVLSEHYEYAIIADGPGSKHTNGCWRGCYRCDAMLENGFILNSKSYCSGCFTTLVGPEDKIKFNDGNHILDITKWIHMTSSTFYGNGSNVDRCINKINNINNGELTFVKTTNSFHNFNGVQKHLFFSEVLRGKTVYCFDNIIINV